MSEPQLVIEIAYAGPQQVLLKRLRVPRGCSAAEALRLAALDPDCAGLDLAGSAIGIFGRLVRGDYVLEDGDRLEVYRPLAADPKEARRARAQQARKKSAR